MNRLCRWIKIDVKRTQYPEVVVVPLHVRERGSKDASNY